MKKVFFYCLITILFLNGCGQTDNSSTSEQKQTTAKEYNMTDIKKAIISIEKEYEDEIKFLTTDEINERGKDILDKLYKKYKLPYGQQIVIRGMVNYNNTAIETCGQFNLSSVENDEDEIEFGELFAIPCYVKNPGWFFLQEKENVIVSGYLRRYSEYTDSENIYCLDNCEIISPKISIPSYSNNVSYYCDDYQYDHPNNRDTYYYRIMGEVKTVTKPNKKILSNFPFEKCKYVVSLTNKKGDVIMWGTSKDVSSLKPKTKICVFAFFCSPIDTNKNYMIDDFGNDTDIYNTNYYIYK